MSHKQVAADVCLQCGKSRTAVKDRYNSPCATATGYEVVETQDDWDRHHWRDWSDAELRAQGVHESLWASNRRTDFYSFEYVWRESECIRKGHVVLPYDADFSVPGRCDRCYEKVAPFHYVTGRPRTTLHANGPGHLASLGHGLTSNPDDVDCKLCLSLLAREKEDA